MFKFKTVKGSVAPVRQTLTSAIFNICVNLKRTAKNLKKNSSDFEISGEKMFIKPSGYAEILTGIFLETDSECVGLLCPVDFLYSRYGLIIPNSPKVFDCNFKGEIFIPVLNISDSLSIIPNNAVLAQFIAQLNIISEVCREKNSFGS